MLSQVPIKLNSTQNTFLFFSFSLGTGGASDFVKASSETASVPANSRFPGASGIGKVTATCKPIYVKDHCTLQASAVAGVTR